MKQHNRYRIFMIFILFSGFVWAQQPKVISQKQKETEETEVEAKDVTVPDEFVNSLDQLLQNWAIDRMAVNSDCSSGVNPHTTEEDYRERLKKLPHLIEMPYNVAVRSFIEVYTQQRRKQVEYMLGLSNYYFPIFEEELEKAGLPLELRFLPIIESSLNPRAVSRAGATGIWQFMLATGKSYDLEVNTLVDERMDPRKSSRAAAQFLKELYSIYSDWHLAIAAYNCGPGNVNKAINRSGGKRDYWTIYSYLPAETRSYVPIFIAANYALSYAEEHNLCAAQVRLPVLTDTVMVNRRVHLEQIASVLNLPLEEVQLLNPQYRRDIVPGDLKPYPICLPQNYANLYIEKAEDIYAHKADILVNNRRDEVKTTQATRVAASNVTYHTVRKGQTLSGLAKRYGTTVRKIQNANGLRTTKIRVGQRLKIPR